MVKPVELKNRLLTSTYIRNKALYMLLNSHIFFSLSFFFLFLLFLFIHFPDFTFIKSFSVLLFYDVISLFWIGHHMMSFYYPTSPEQGMVEVYFLLRYSIIYVVANITSLSYFSAFTCGTEWFCISFYFLSLCACLSSLYLSLECVILGVFYFTLSTFACYQLFIN